MQMPRWLFSDPRYTDMDLDAKVAYTFLLNRFQLSRRNGWTNEQGEVFVIFPRKELAKELRICEKRVMAAFQTSAERNLIWEKRCGRGDANQIYLAHVQPQDDFEYTSAPFLPEGPSGDSRTAGRWNARRCTAPSTSPTGSVCMCNYSYQHQDSDFPGGKYRDPGGAAARAGDAADVWEDSEQVVTTRPHTVHRRCGAFMLLRIEARPVLYR